MSQSTAADQPGGEPEQKSNGMVGGLLLFLRQVIAELRKVVWPTREQLVTYFIVTLVFVIVFMALVSLLDLGFGRLAFWVFT